MTPNLQEIRQSWWPNVAPLIAKVDAELAKRRSKPAAPKPLWPLDRRKRRAELEDARRCSRANFMALAIVARDKVGGIAALARRVGVVRSAVSNWVAGDRMPPENRKPGIEQKLREIVNS